MKYEKEFYFVSGFMILITLGLMLVTAFGFAGAFHMHWALWILEIGLLIEMMLVSALCINFIMLLKNEKKEQTDDGHRI